jgi:hypothetical protein
MNKYELFDKNHQDAIASIKLYICDSNETEMQAITEYLLETDANPYGFLPGEWAGCTGTATDFIRLLNMIHHAIYDDGDISFPIVNGEPRISFIWKNEDNYNSLILSESERDMQERLGVVYGVEQCDNILDFISKHKEYHRKDIKRCFIGDAAMHGWEFAVRHNSAYFNFDPYWEFDDEVISEVNRKRKLRGFSEI